MPKFIITPELMKAAKDYMPMIDKIALSKQIAELCMRDVPYDESDNDKQSAIDTAMRIKYEDAALETVLLMSTLLNFYFGIEIETGKDELQNMKSFDYYASAYPISQITRYQKSTDEDIKNKAFNIIGDFKEFKKLVGAEIYNMRTVANDTIARALSAISALAENDAIWELVTQSVTSTDEATEEAQA